MGDEGNVYHCAWKLDEDGGYVGWLIGRPSVRAEGLSASEMSELMTDAIAEAFDDFEPAVDFDPALNCRGNGDAGLFVDDVVAVGWNASFRYRPSSGQVFAGGQCPECGRGRGVRSEEPLAVDLPKGRADGAIAWMVNDGPPERDVPASAVIVSEGFLGALSPDERAAFDARPVRLAGRSRRKFLEVLPRAFVPRVAIRGRELRGWRCGSCGTSTWSHVGTLGYGVLVVSRADLPGAPCFFVGDGRDYSLCMSGKRWRALRGGPNFRKAGGSPLAVVSPELATRDPRLPSLEERRAAAGVPTRL